MEFYQNIGAKIAFFRKLKKITQEELGSLVDLSRTTIVNIEKGRQRIDLHTLLIVSKILEIDFLKFIEDFDFERLIPRSTKEILKENHPLIFKDVCNFIMHREIKEQGAK